MCFSAVICHYNSLISGIKSAGVSMLYSLHLLGKLEKWEMVAICLYLKSWNFKSTNDV